MFFCWWRRISGWICLWCNLYYREEKQKERTKLRRLGASVGVNGRNRFSSKRIAQNPIISGIRLLWTNHRTIGTPDINFCRSQPGSQLSETLRKERPGAGRIRDLMHPEPKLDKADPGLSVVVLYFFAAVKLPQNKRNMWQTSWCYQPRIFWCRETSREQTIFSTGFPIDTTKNCFVLCGAEFTGAVDLFPVVPHKLNGG